MSRKYQPKVAASVFVPIERIAIPAKLAKLPNTNASFGLCKKKEYHQ